VKHLIAAFAKNPVLANILMLTVVFGGILCAVNMQTEMFPEFSLDRVIVMVVYPGTSPSEIEEGISVKIEEAIQGVVGVKKIESVSKEGVSTVIVELKSGVDDPRKVQYDIRDAVERIETFPEDSERPITTEMVLRRQVINVAVYGDAEEATLKEVARSVKDDLLAMPAISQVSWVGVRDYEISVEVAESALREYGLTFSQVAAAVRSGSANLPGGTIRGAAENVKLNTEGRKYLASEYGKIVVLARPDGTKVRLNQIAEVIDGFEDDPRYTRFNGKPSVTIAVHKTTGEDAIEIADAVRNYCNRRRAALPEGVALETWADMSDFIKSRLSLLLRNARIGMLLVFICLWIFLNTRLSFWVAMGIPTSFAGGLLAMYLTGQTINMMSMFALIMVMGIVVDDAIIVGENVYAQVRRGVTTAKAIVGATAQVALPVLASVSTTVCAFAPLLFIGGVMGKFIRVLPMAVIATLAASMVECFLILPAHLRHMRTIAQKRREGRHKRHAGLAIRAFIERRVEFLTHRLYRSVYRKALRGRYVTLALALLALAVSAGLFVGGVVRYTLFPKGDSDILFASVTFPDGTPLEVTERALNRMESAAIDLNGSFAEYAEGKMVRQVSTFFGQTMMMMELSGGNVGEVLVQLAPAEERNIESEKLISAWREKVGPIPDVVSVQYRGMHGGPGGQPIEIRLRAEELPMLRAAAAELKKKLTEYAGLSDIQDDYRPGKKEFHVTLKPQGRVLGITTSDLGRQLRQGFFGDEAVRIQRGRDDVKVKVRYPRRDRRRLSDVERIRVRAPSGAGVPFHEVADASITREPASIRRMDGKRVVNVSADIDEAVANANEVLEDIRTTFMDDFVARYPGLSYSYEGQKQESAEALSSLYIAFPLALIGIFAILAVQFRSYGKPLVIMLSIPFGMVGAVLGHYVMGFDITLLSVFGIVAVSGVVVNDALVLIDFVNRNIRNGMTVFDAVLEAGPARFRAIVLTSMTTIAGLAPLILERSFQAQLLIPMAISVSFGLALATLVNLFVTPSVYLVLNDVKRAAFLLTTNRWPSPEEMEPEVRGAAYRSRFTTSKDEDNDESLQQE